MSKKPVPFRKKVKDTLNNIGGFSAFVSVVCGIAAYNGEEGAAGIMVMSGLVAGGFFAWASTITPRLMTHTQAAAGVRQEKRWEW